ncbi:MAG: 50S ribosomal protein L6 [Deltaproteobacteria bacterium]|nr:MAG: 50S ribosomal protein L6 [Deltaproteobacteria bacterium]
MSRIGKQPVSLPPKVKVSLHGQRLEVEGPKGKLSINVPEGISVEIDGSEVRVTRADDTRQQRALHGLTRSLLQGAVTGVSEGFTRKLEINGVGYRADVQGNKINLSLGYSHPVVYEVPEGVTAKTPSPTEILLESADKQKLGVVAAQIRALRPPEPYKGKGIKYAEEHIRRKVGKAGA